MKASDAKGIEGSRIEFSDNGLKRVLRVASIKQSDKPDALVIQGRSGDRYEISKDTEIKILP